MKGLIMMKQQTPFTMPGASDAYITAREKLMDAEGNLREQVERVAEMRRALPPGPNVPDYEFFDGDKRVKLSELFSDEKPYLVMYHVMYWPDDREFCPMCSMWVDGWDGIAHHVAQRANIVAASLAPVEELRAWAKKRGWRRIRLLADASPAFARDTGAEDSDGDPSSTVLVFEKTPRGIRHVYTGHAEFRDGYRGVDQLCATWHILDLLPSGRGDFLARNDYVT
jgi:predicted dithiol-disulfide oxidoreductase (DUF899 family)